MRNTALKHIVLIFLSLSVPSWLVLPQLLILSKCWNTQVTPFTWWFHPPSWLEISCNYHFFPGLQPIHFLWTLDWHIPLPVQHCLSTWLPNGHLKFNMSTSEVLIFFLKPSFPTFFSSWYLAALFQLLMSNVLYLSLSHFLFSHHTTNLFSIPFGSVSKLVICLESYNFLSPILLSPWFKPPLSPGIMPAALFSTQQPKWSF